MLPLWVTLAIAGPWTPLGPVPPPARLVSEMAGPDLVRAEIAEGGQTFWLDVTEDRGGEPFCRGGGLALQVRKSLDHPDESFQLDPVPGAVTTACGRLEAAAPALREAMAESVPLKPTPADALDPDRPGPDGTPETPIDESSDGSSWWEQSQRPFAKFAPRPFQLVVLAWAAALLVAGALAVRRSPRLALGAVALGAVALALRLRFAPLTVLLGGDAAYERLTSALGRGSTDRYYGETWPSLFGLVQRAGRELGVLPARITDVVHDGNLLASAAAAPLAWGVARRAGLSPRAALAAGAALAALPHAVVLARIEDHTVLVGTLQLLAGFAALGTTRPDAVLAVLSAVLLGHLRPELLATAGVLLLPLLARRRWFLFLLGAGLLATRLTYLPHADAPSPIQFERLLDVKAWPMLVAAWVGAPAVPLPGLYGLAGVGGLAGALALRRAGPGLGAPARPTAWLLLVLAATTLPYLPKDLPDADPLRFSLPAEAWLVVLAVAGGQALLRAFRTHRVFLAVGLVLVAWTASRRFAPLPGHTRPWAWEHEYTFLRDHLPVADPADPADLNRGTRPNRGWYDDGQDPNGALGRWMTVVSGTVWVPWKAGTPKPGDLVFRGTADRLAGRWLGQRCGLDPVAETELNPATSDGWVDFGAEPVRFTLYRVRECGDTPPR